MHVIARRTLKEFIHGHSDAEQALDSWYYEAKHASWQTPLDIKDRFPDASILPNNRVVFNIKGNQYRLIVHIRYDTGTVFIRFIGTHAEYDRVKAEEV